jgi:uncharacterized protein YbjT (DUF2867 family)
LADRSGPEENSHGDTSPEPATTVVATVARELDSLEALVSISQMTVSQMTTISTEESHQQRLHFLSEQVLNWSGLPVVHVRPTMFSKDRRDHARHVARRDR